MADTRTIQKAGNVSSPKQRSPSRSQQLNKLYSLPTPLRTFPLPTFVPHNPISLFHLIYAWVSHTIYPPSSCPETPHQGWFSVETRSVHVTDSKSIRSVWEQGFYGKGSLSRSEPSWLEREKRREGIVSSKTSEEVTKNRRAERQQIKWERAVRERELIEKKLSEERSIAKFPGEKTNSIQIFFLAPVGPLELLALPNSSKDLLLLDETLSSQVLQDSEDTKLVSKGHSSVLTNHGSTKEPSMTMDISRLSVQQLDRQRDIDMLGITLNGKTDGTTYHDISATINSNRLDNTPDLKQPLCQKSVRFSPTVEQTTFLRSEPPSPDLAAATVTKPESPLLIHDQEHLQLTMEEAFFLCYGLGVLQVLDPVTKDAISTRDLFSIFRKTSYFPPPELDMVSPDDPFMLSYVVYHHFRSLGWVVRGGTKFSVDYLLYNRGPVFSHAEFAIVILPSYSDPYWASDQSLREYVTGKQNRTWPWLHCINRVNSQVKKTLVLAYVDIPRPLPKHEEDALGIDGILRLYKVREVVVKRWLANRTRD